METNHELVSAQALASNRGKFLLPRPKEHGKIKGYQKGKGMEKQ
jgi:hypothetical protein